MPDRNDETPQPKSVSRKPRDAARADTRDAQAKRDAARREVEQLIRQVKATVTGV